MINNTETHKTISGFTFQLTKLLAIFLADKLPLVSDKWWSECVLDKLSYKQQDMVERKGVQSLKDLDLAALLKILDKNWFELFDTTSERLDIQFRHFTKEMQTIRNRWAHTSTDIFSDDDIYRDLDTMQRFAAFVEAGDDLIDEIQEAKKSINSNQTSSTEVTESNISDEEFVVGKTVELKSDAEIKGPITEVIPSAKENSYKVWIDGGPKTYYASQLKLHIEKTDEILLSCEDFHAYVTALQIKHPSLSSLYSLEAARIDYVPYQFRPVLKFIRSDRPRLLIADSVGVGKTIEAGLILRELQARRDIKSVLIICPRPLITEDKWRGEMKRFEEDFVNLDSQSLRFCISETEKEGAWPDRYNKVVVPYSLFDELSLKGVRKQEKRGIGLSDLETPPRFDLVIVDEAHHIRNRETFRHQAVRFFCDNAEAVLFLTATPIQLGSQDLFVLLQGLRPDLVISRESFDQMSEPNTFINKAVSAMRGHSGEWQDTAKAELEAAADTEWGKAVLADNPNFTNIVHKLGSNEMDNSTRVKMISSTEELHTFSSIINRTRRRDIGDFTVREPQTIEIAFTPAQRELHDEVLRIQADIFRKMHGDHRVNFLLSTIRRQTASCIHGLVPLLNNILNRHIGEVEYYEMGYEEEFDISKAKVSISAQINELLEAANKINDDDPKLEVLLKIISDKQAKDNNKLMLFSSFRHTLSYLHNALVGKGLRVGMVHGGTPEEDRVRLRTLFQKPKEDANALDIMLFSEIGCEGLDYQFCDCMVNYDLPWNPMRIEQRIGRIDRRGQKSEKVAIFNLITPDTVDADIFYRCLDRIGVFENSLGGNEEILGDIAKEINSIASNYNLTEKERTEKLQQLSDNKIREANEQEKMEERDKELFGLNIKKQQTDADIETAKSFWLSAKSLYRLTSRYLKERLQNDQNFITGEQGSLKALSLRLSEDRRNLLLDDFKKLSNKKDIASKKWQAWLSGGEQKLSITFDMEYACDNPNVTFITPVHPLIKQAATYLSQEQQVLINISAKSTVIPKGRYEFALYLWKFSGIKGDLQLCPISTVPEVTDHLNKLLIESKDSEYGLSKEKVNNLEELEKMHYDLWSQRLKEHQGNIEDLVGYREKSLEITHKARMRALNEQFEAAKDEKIATMRHSQVRNAETDYSRRSQELAMAIERADITHEQVAHGVLYIDRY